MVSTRNPEIEIFTEQRHHFYRFHSILILLSPRALRLAASWQPPAPWPPPPARTPVSRSTHAQEEPN
jgi:hypothetical protein